MAKFFKNPNTNKIKNAHGISLLWFFLFSVFYFIFTGNWKHAWILIGFNIWAVLVGSLMIPSLTFLSYIIFIIAGIVYLCAFYSINADNYRQKGWIEVTPAGESGKDWVEVTPAVKTMSDKEKIEKAFQKSDKE